MSAHNALTGSAHGGLAAIEDANCVDRTKRAQRAICDKRDKRAHCDKRANSDKHANCNNSADCDNLAKRANVVTASYSMTVSDALKESARTGRNSVFRGARSYRSRHGIGAMLLASVIFLGASVLSGVTSAVALAAPVATKAGASGAGAGAADSAGALDSSYFNPQSAADDVLVPLPCGGVMAFRKIYTANGNKMQDKNFMAGSTNTSSLLTQSNNKRYIQGSFHDQGGYYYLLAKYELNQAQYNLLQAYKQGQGACPTTKLKKMDKIAKGDLSWFDAIALSREYSHFLAQLASRGAGASGSAKGSSGGAGGSSGRAGGAGGSSGGAGGSAALFTQAPGTVIPLVISEGKNVVPFVRLPTDSEWEYAARGGNQVTSSQFSADIFPLSAGKSLADYAWYYAKESTTTRKVQAIGLKEPNPLGLYDILGNVAEMMFDPFAATRTGRLHGQSGGVTVRGGNVGTTKEELTTALRVERPFFTNGKENKSSDVGLRFALALPVTPSRAELNTLNQEIAALGNDNDSADSKSGGNLNTVATLDQILAESKATQDKIVAAYQAEQDALKAEQSSLKAEQAKLKAQNQADQEKIQAAQEQFQEAQAKFQSERESLIADREALLAANDSLRASLTELRMRMITANSLKDEMRDRAIVSNLRLGGYLCSTLAQEQIALERTLKNEEILRKIQPRACRTDEDSPECKLALAEQEQKLQANRDLANATVDFYVSYYADHLTDTLDTFDYKFVARQQDNAAASLGQSQSSLSTYIERFVKDLDQYQQGSRDLESNKKRWVKQCRAMKQ